MNPLLAVLLVGVAQIDITPTWWPVIVNCYMLERQTSVAESPIYAKAFVFAQGKEKTAIVTVDSCMMPRELIDKSKQIAFEKTGIPVNRQLISATHTHMAPAAMSCLGSRVDEKYAAWLPGKLAEAIVAANERLKPARVGSFAVEAGEQTYVRQFFYRSDKKQLDPFGERSVHANMHPGYQNPDMTLPTGPKDAALTVLAIEGTDGKPMGMLANFAMHYFDTKPVSASYFGIFAKQLAARIGAPADYVIAMSQGVSGDLMWMDYANPAKKNFTVDEYTRGVVDAAERAWRGVRYEAKPRLRMIEREATFERRRASPERIVWARKMYTETPRNQPEVYAREVLEIEADPVRQLKLQVMQIGELGIVAWPNEVFSISGLKLRERTGFRQLMNITLANGAEGYIPPAELHPFGGYTTWPAKTASLATDTEGKMVALYTEMLGELKANRKPARPTADYWPLEDLTAPAGLKVEGLRAYGIPGKQGRAMYLSGGRVEISTRRKKFKVTCWVWPVATRRWELLTVENSTLILKDFEGAIDEIRIQ